MSDIIWLDIDEGKEPFVVAEVIFLEGDDETSVHFRIPGIDKPIMLNTEPLYYDLEDFDNLVKDKNKVLVNALSFSASDAFPAEKEDKILFLNKNGGVTGFVGEMICPDDKKKPEMLWADAGIPINIINIGESDPVLFSCGKFIKKDTAGLRAGRIMKR